MKNITAFAVLVIMIQCAQPVFSQEEQAASYAVSICPQFGFIYGQAEEIVYPSLGYKAEKLSQLLWDIKPVFYYGLTMDFSRARPMTQWGFFTNFSLKSGIPGNSGSMEDRDWMSRENTALTHYSIHDNSTDNLLLLDLSAGFSFPIKHILLLKTYLTASYMYYSFCGEDGYYTYAQYLGSGKYTPIDSAQKEPLEGKIITYAQNWLIIAPGVSLGYYFNTRFYTELIFRISPLVFCNDLDKHLMTGVEYRDYMWGGLFLEPGFHFSWLAGEHLELSLDFSWRYMSGTKGEIYTKYPNSTMYIQGGEAGAGMSMFDAGLCLKVRL